MPGQAITLLKLAQFRSHCRARLQLDGRPIAIHGPNGAGKTNILEAVSLLSPGRGLRRASPEDLARRPGVDGWKVAAELTATGRTHEVETWMEGTSPRQTRIDGKAAPQAALGRIVAMLWLVPAMDRLWTEAADGRRRFLDRMTLSFRPDHAEATLAYEKAMRQRNRLMKDQVVDPGWYGALERQMAEAGAEIGRNRAETLDLIAGAQREAQTAFPAADLAFEDPPDAEALAKGFRDGRARDIAAGRTLTGPHRADLDAVYRDKGMPARDCSTGEQKALLISLVLANARALAAVRGAPPVLLLDEVAAHLDEGRRAALYDETCALGAQAWLTGTGPELFEALGDRAQYLSVTEHDGESRIAGEGTT